VRARPGAPVAAPIDWDELSRGDLDARSWTVRNVLRRLAARDDPWKGIRHRARSLAKARARLEEITETERG
jgi:bifunctional non-homologous end joining protein LigD